MNDFLLMDCMEGMLKYPDQYFDLAIVDPPLMAFALGIEKAIKWLEDLGAILASLRDT